MELPTRKQDTPHEESTNFQNNHSIKRAQWFQLVGESVVFCGSSLYLLDAIQAKNPAYVAGSICCQLGSILMIAQSILLIKSINGNNNRK